MKRSTDAALAFVTVASAAQAKEAPSEADVGSCYSVKPICMGSQRAVCVCDYAQNCFWACR